MQGIEKRKLFCYENYYTQKLNLRCIKIKQLIINNYKLAQILLLNLDILLPQWNPIMLSH